MTDRKMTGCHGFTKKKGTNMIGTCSVGDHESESYSMANNGFPPLETTVLTVKIFATGYSLHNPNHSTPTH
jgi:hypothetical protein